MACPSRKFSTVQSYYSEVEEKINQLAVVRGAAYPTGDGCHNRAAEPVARVQLANVLLKNEIYDLFKEFYRHGDWSSNLEAAFRSGRNYPILELIAGKIRLEILEEKFYYPSPPSSDSFGNQSD